jgi:hypothetical protein
VCRELHFQMGSPASGSPHRRRLSFKRLAVASVVTVMLVAATWRLTASGEPAPGWSAERGTPPPDGFLYLMFPAGDDVGLFDQPDGTRVGTLARAVANTHAEISAGGWTAVRSVGGNSWVRMSDLRYFVDGEVAPG